MRDENDDDYDNNKRGGLRCTFPLLGNKTSLVLPSPGFRRRPRRCHHRRHHYQHHRQQCLFIVVVVITIRGPVKRRCYSRRVLFFCLATISFSQLSWRSYHLRNTMASKETAGWGEGLLKELQPIRRLTDATEGVYNKARSLFMDVKAKFNKAEDTISMEKALSVLRDELHFPEDRAINFLCRLKKQEAACPPDSDQLNAANFNQFIGKITEIKQEIIPAFSEYDADHNGLISLQEATAILGRPPFNFPQARVDSLLKRFDRDNNGQLDIEEFAAFYAEARIR